MAADNEIVTTPAEDTAQPVLAGAGGSRNNSESGLWATLAVILLVALLLLIVGLRLVPRVPDVTGLTRAAADQALAKAGYKTGEVSLVTTSKVSRGHVAEQAPEPGAILSKGSAVDLVVVKGADLVEVPDVVGHNTADAAQTISATGLGLKTVGEYSDVAPADAVIAQVPAAGEKVPPQAAVTIVVSLGSETAAAQNGATSGTQAGSTSVSGSGASGGNGSTTNPQASPFQASYPGSSVYSSGGNIYIRFAGGGGRYLTSGSARDTNPILSPNAKYVVFMRAPGAGQPANQIGRVNLTNFQVAILDLPYPTDFSSPSMARYTSMSFAPSKTGTMPGSDWLVIGQLFANDPDASGGYGGRVLVCNVPMDSTWVSWNTMLRPADKITISGSSLGGNVHVKANAFSRDFNAYTGLYSN